MRGWLKRRVIRWFRVPAEPEPPAGDSASIRVFRAAPEYFRYKLIGWAIGQLGTLVGLLVGLGIGLAFLDRWLGSGLIGALIAFFAGLAWVGYFAQLPVTFVALHLDYEMRWYMLSDRALRIREGIVTVREKTMTFANIQQISVKQGPIQRLLGIADVEVRTAGGGGPSEDGGEDMHRGFFRGVADAETIRDTVRQRVRAYRDAGPGDAERRGPIRASASDTVTTSTTVPAETLRAAREVLDEARSLRAAAGG
jgi:membrane protein YdbS with pleckstrin-like domain